MSTLFDELRKIVFTLSVTPHEEIIKQNMLAVAFSNTARYNVSGPTFDKFLDIDGARLSILFDNRGNPNFLIRDRTSLLETEVHQITLLELEESMYLLDKLYATIEDIYCLSIHDFSGGNLSYFE